MTDRFSSEFEDSRELVGQPDFEKFKSRWPKLHIMLCNMAQFHKRCLISEYRMSKGEMYQMPCNPLPPKLE